VENNTGLLDGRMERMPRILICDTVGKVAGVAFPDEQRVSSPIQCLSTALSSIPDFIVIHFGSASIQERTALVELAVALKQNCHTCESPVLALLKLKHRRLVEDLAGAGVNYLKIVGDVELSSKPLHDFLQNLGPGDSPLQHLRILCPFIHYSKTDSRHEMSVCGAYLDRMVLGGRRLRELCQTENHIHCEYYLNPRTTS